MGSLLSALRVIGARRTRQTPDPWVQTAAARDDSRVESQSVTATEEQLMKHTTSLGACFLLVATTAFAEGPLIKTLDFHNVHIRVSDPARAGEWYVQHLGATPGRAPRSGTDWKGSTSS